MSTDRVPPRVARKSLELKVIQSYVLILRTPKDANGDRVVSLERHGPYDIRLVESPSTDGFPFWVELFDHNAKLTLDSYAGNDPEATALAAEAFISQAKHLYQSGCQYLK